VSDALSTDHFSGHAAHYARHRPSYPPQLFAWLAAQAPAADLAWDCATGNGQAALALAEHFRQVHATDLSAEQLAQATPHPRITYRQGPAEASGLADRSCDLVTVAQALHWFCNEQPSLPKSGGCSSPAACSPPGPTRCCMATRH
jgi:trans-aconitate methyltransferase